MLIHNKDDIQFVNEFPCFWDTLYLLSYFWCLLIIDRGSSKFKWSLSLHWHVWFTTVPLTAVYDHKLTRYPWFKNWLCSIVVKTYGFMLQRQWKKLKWRHLPYHWWYGGKGTVLNQACHFFLNVTLNNNGSSFNLSNQGCIFSRINPPPWPPSIMIMDVLGKKL